TELDAFVQVLRHAHRSLGAEAEFLGGFLLHGAGGERRGRIFSALATANVRDGKRLPVLEVGENRACGGLAADFRLFPVELMQLGRETLSIFFEKRLD